MLCDKSGRHGVREDWAGWTVVGGTVIVSWRPRRMRGGASLERTRAADRWGGVAGVDRAPQPDGHPRAP